ncbi:beta-N-acetylhexosaminidase [uncultured Bartonella sp.]|uniref:beta-N-acetylhexosaminidase n=1 Tax=uncultured Bartonella sp. TaxID=104108 RepID=UPI0026001089|nr:beta-N-acetylhexosaminidase [uncultured Bartonella sp.]
MPKMKAMIVGVAGPVLTADEKQFIAENHPWAFILFARNIGTAREVKELTSSLRKASGRDDVFIFIDQEGGRVQRLRAPLAPDYPPAATLGDLYKKNRQKGLRAAWIMSRLHAFDLMRLGINADCLPLLDVPIEGADNVIGTRAYGNAPEIVTAMGRAAAEGLQSGGVLPVMKHIPGHGRALCDTHKSLARVSASLETLRLSDFAPFEALSKLPVAMTAHVVYESVDPLRPATLSKAVINTIIRDEIGFDGLLMTDDLSMKALSGDLGDLTKQAFEAGCDLVLHCNGESEEMRKIAAATPWLEGKSLARADRATNFVRKPDEADEKTLRDEFRNLLTLV